MKRKILFLIDSLGGGGAEKVLITLLEHLDKSKFDVTLTTIVDFGIHRNKVPEWIHYKPVLRTPKSRFEKLVYSIKYKLIHRLLPLTWVYGLFIPRKNDVEIAFVEGFATRLLSFSTNKQAKKLAWVHTDLINNHWISKIYADIDSEKISYSKYNTIIGVSNQVTNAVKDLYSLKNAITLYNPIDSNDILSKSNEVIADFGGHGRIRLVTIGRLENQKGFDRLLRIMKKLIFEDSLNLELWILGDGTLRNVLGSFTTENGLDAYINFLGFHTNPYPYIAQSDLFVCSSRSEGYSTAVTEAIILGLPIVTTNCSGMKELLGENNEYGVVTENNEEALYQALKDILTDKEELNHYKQAVKKRSKDFSIEKLMNPIEDLLES